MIDVSWVEMSNFKSRLKEEYGVEYVEHVFNVVEYPEYMCKRIDTIRDMFNRLSGRVSDFEAAQQTMGDTDEDYERFMDFTDELYEAINDEFGWYENEILELEDQATRLLSWVDGLIGVGESLTTADFSGVSDETMRDVYDFFDAIEYERRRDFVELDKDLMYEIDRIRRECSELVSLRRYGSAYNCMERLTVYSLDDGSYLEGFRSVVEKLRSHGMDVKDELMLMLCLLDREHGNRFIGV